MRAGVKIYFIRNTHRVNISILVNIDVKVNQLYGCQSYIGFAYAIPSFGSLSEFPRYLHVGTDKVSILRTFLTLTSVNQMYR